ncbi:hypothetical protein SUGI_0626540 [Cryptomeria japonica]|nr:hypothetical protein SUGI_0626540 [Cryptomeria japonica]
MGKKLLCWALFLIAASFIIPAIANKPTYCGTEDRYEVKVDNVRITPNPIVSGKSATFNISATSEDVIPAGKLSIEVYLFGICVYTEIHDLCSKTTCPIKKGDFILTNSQSLPWFTPPGNYKLRMKMMDADDKILTCIYIEFSIVFGTGSVISEI